VSIDGVGKNGGIVFVVVFAVFVFGVAAIVAAAAADDEYPRHGRGAFGAFFVV
jgi:hypothetical protein